jgi:hypothetical protein
MEIFLILALVAVVGGFIAWWFFLRKKPKPPEPPPPDPDPATWNDVPYPRETSTSPRYATVAELMAVWFSRWFVVDTGFWSNISNLVVIIDPSMQGAAYTTGKEIHIHPDFSDPGVLAHEVCHVDWPLLSPNEQQDFADLYPVVAARDKLVALVTKELWGEPKVEAHAEIYRYLGKYMPVELRRFYPHLLVG